MIRSVLSLLQRPVPECMLDFIENVVSFQSEGNVLQHSPVHNIDHHKKHGVDYVYDSELVIVCRIFDFKILMVIRNTFLYKELENLTTDFF